MFEKNPKSLIFWHVNSNEIYFGMVFKHCGFLLRLSVFYPKSFSEAVIGEGDCYSDGTCFPGKSILAFGIGIIF